MIRSFCVGAMVGYFFGATKEGQSLHKRFDDMLSDLLSKDTADKVSDAVNDVEAKVVNAAASFGKGAFGSRGKEENGQDGKRQRDSESSRFRDGNGNSGSRDGDGRNGGGHSYTGSRQTQKSQRDSDSAEESGEQDFTPKNGEVTEHAQDGVLDAKKAQELADKLGAKPAAPEDEMKAPFIHDQDERHTA